MLFLLLLSLFKNNYIVNDFILHVKDINSEGTLLTLCTSRSVPTAKYQQKIVHDYPIILTLPVLAQSPCGGVGKLH